MRISDEEKAQLENFSKECLESRMELIEENYRALAMENKFLMQERDKGIERLKKLENTMKKIESIMLNVLYAVASNPPMPEWERK